MHYFSMLCCCSWLCLCTFFLNAEEARADGDVSALIRGLQSRQNQEREDAKKQLIALGDRAVEALKVAARDSDQGTKTVVAEVLLAIHEAKMPCIKPARETYRTYNLLYQSGRKDDLESVYIWSLRWAEAVDASEAEHASALEEHQARMQELLQDVKKLVTQGRATNIDVSAMEYYLKQAEKLVKQAKAKAEAMAPKL
jgi:hypothetical protein